MLDSRILCRLHTRPLQETQDIQFLDQAVQDLATGLQQGHGTVKQLLASHSQGLKDYFHSRFESLAQATQSRLTYQCLLKSLFFPDILARQEQSPEAYQGTCRWIDLRRPCHRAERNPVMVKLSLKWLETSNDVYWLDKRQAGIGKVDVS